jgi:hypothetical protein
VKAITFKVGEREQDEKFSQGRLSIQETCWEQAAPDGKGTMI